MKNLNFEKFKFPIFLNVEKMSFLLSPKTIFIFYFYIHAHFDKQINKLLIKLFLICCIDVKSYLGPKKQHQISFCLWNLNGSAAHNLKNLFLWQTISVSKNDDKNLSIWNMFRLINLIIRWKNSYWRVQSLASRSQKSQKMDESAFIVRSIFLLLKELTCVI